MKIVRGCKTELDVNDRQRTACVKHAGAARYAYNWGLRRKIDAYQATGRSPTAIDLHRELNVLKKTELAWMYQVSKCAPHTCRGTAVPWGGLAQPGPGVRQLLSAGEGEKGRDAEGAGGLSALQEPQGGSG